MEQGKAVAVVLEENKPYTSTTEETKCASIPKQML
jgi:hypothetical protein